MADINKLQASINANAKASDSWDVSLKTNFSGHHIRNSAFFARKSANIEQNFKENFTDELRIEHRAYVTGAIIASVASLEATINEIFLDAIDKGNTWGNFDIMVSNLLSELWPIMEKSAILYKYQVVLTTTNKEKFNAGIPPYQDVDNLIKLRNALIHYKPEWDTDSKIHKSIEDRLKNNFNINPFSHFNDAFFPKKCLGHGCAEWAVRSSIKFVQAFFEKMSFSPKWTKHELSTLETSTPSHKF